MLRFLLASLPVATLAVVGVLVLWVGAERPIEALRFWGGPTDRSPVVSGWLEATSEGRPMAQAELRVTARPVEGTALTRNLILDREGRAELVFDFTRAPQSFELSATLNQRELGKGRVALTAQRWLARAGRRGGFSRLQQPGALTLQIAPARGALAVPFFGTLVVRVARDGAPLDQAKVELKSEGARIKDGSVVTNAQGLAHFAFAPAEHVVTARVSVQALDGVRAELFASVPVVPGAILVEREGNALRVLSPIERAEAFLSLVTESGRWSGARVPLTARGDGTAQGLLELGALPSEPVWAVAKSDPAAPSGTCVGWPLSASNEPALTLDAADVLLLDTEPSARAAERERRRGVRRVALAVGSLGALVSVLSLVVTARRRRNELGSHLSAELGDQRSAALLPRDSARALLAVVLIVLGFFAVATIVAWRLI